MNIQEPLSLHHRLEPSHTPFRKQVFDVTVTEVESVVKPQSMSQQPLDSLSFNESMRCETIQPSFFFNPVEFDGIKTRIIELLPNPQEFNGVTVTQPVSD